MVRPLEGDSPRTVIKQMRMSPVEAEIFESQRDVREFGSDSSYLRYLVTEDGRQLGAHDGEE